MRLLDVYELKVKEFNDNNRPPFVILSHTWGDGEVSFQDIHTPQAATMAGYKKIQKFCEIAKHNGFNYVWIDTCCIDKTSSSELSEAINSMFNWYRIADVCYVFLSDVGSTKPESEGSWSEFSSSLWFTRGWTLQELLAPELLVFYNKDWTRVGTKRTLGDIISETTDIPFRALVDTDCIRKYTVAERMLWASKRKTTRVEDLAYCLMGVFNVNMPPLYGEGDKAFMRLQYEIMKDSPDQSIFAWSWYSDRAENNGNFGGDDVSRGVRLLARSPSDFLRSKRVIRKSSSRPKAGSRPFSMTNQGLHIWLPCSHLIGRFRTRPVFVLAEIECAAGLGGNIQILLKQDTGSERYVRCAESDVPVLSSWLDDQEAMELFIIPIPGNTTVFKSRHDSKLTGHFQFVKNPSPKSGYRIKYFFDSGNLVYRLQELTSLEHYFDYRENRDKSVHIIYLVVQAIKNPNIQAVIALGSIQKFFSRSTEYYFRVFPGSDIPRDLAKLATTPLSTHMGAFMESCSMIFRDRTGKEFVRYFPEDEMVEHLHENYIITFAARAGPSGLSSDSNSRAKEHNYRVYISLLDASREDGVSDATLMDDGA